MKPLRICFTSNSSPWTKYHGGGQIVVHNLAQALANMGHQVTVLYTGPHPQRSPKIIETDYHVEWASYIGYPWTAVFRQMNAYTVYQKLKHIHTRYRFDVINAIAEEALLLPKFCRDTGARLFFSIEHPQLSSIRPTLKWPNLLHFILSVVRTRDLLINRFVCRQTEGVITPSEYTKSQACRYFQIEPSNIRVINHGVIDEMLLEDLEPAQRSPDGPFLFFGRFEPQKGVDLLIKAYYRLSKEKIAFKRDLILIGSGPHEKEYRNMVSNLGIQESVRFEGWQSTRNIREQMSKASLCVLPSRSESFGLSMAETLAQGLPLITASAGSIPEVVDFGQGAWLAKPDDENSLLKMICEALDDYPESLKKARHGRDYVRSRFTWQKAAQDYETFYQDTLEKEY